MLIGPHKGVVRQRPVWPLRQEVVLLMALEERAVQEVRALQVQRPLRTLVERHHLRFLRSLRRQPGRLRRHRLLVLICAADPVLLTKPAFSRRIESPEDRTEVPIDTGLGPRHVVALQPFLQLCVGDDAIPIVVHRLEGSNQGTKLDTQAMPKFV